MNKVNDVITSLQNLAKYFLEKEKKQQKRQQSEAPKFNTLDFLKTDEVGLSRIIAFLLDPSEKHGQGRLFLNQFIQEIKRFDLLAYDNVEVTVEKQLINSSRRHDILVVAKLDGETTWCICIENKLKGAIDQEEKVQHYLEDIQKISDNHLILYLSPQLETPSESSISHNNWRSQVEDNKAKAIDAKIIYQWLENCSPYAVNIELFVIQIKQYLRENILMDFNEQEKQYLIKKITHDEGLFSAVMALEKKSYTSLMLDDLFQQVKGKLESSEHKKWNIEGSKWNQATRGIYIKCNKNFYFAFESQTASGGFFENWYYGIKLYSQDDKSDHKVEMIIDHFASGTKPIKGFPWAYYRDVDELYQGNWNQRLSVWQNIAGGELAEYIFKQFEDIVHQLTKIEVL